MSTSPEASALAIIFKKVRNRFRDFLQTHGSTKTKQGLWDEEFENGRWDCLDITTDDCVYPQLEKWTRGGSILDLGCGSGNTASELNFDAFSQYTGVDISEAALAKARERSELNGRTSKCRFVQGDVVSYQPTQKVDVVLFRESIYYIKRPQVQAVLTRYAQWLTDDGVVIVRIWNGKGKLKIFAEIIEDNFRVIDEHRNNESGAIVLVFRSRNHAERN